MTRVVIHIGSHKTGTTYLQQGFVALRPALSAAGIDYPAEWQDHLHGHHSLVRMLAESDAATLTRLSMLVDTAGRAGRGVLLSSENFENLDEAAIGRLGTALLGHAVEIVFFSRHWSGLLPSAWQEEIKQGGSETYPQFLLTHIANPSASRLLNPAFMLDRFAAAFGRNAIRLIGYDRLIDSGDDLLDFFLRALLKVTIVPPERGRRINRSLPAVDIELIRLLNAMAGRASGSVPGGVWPMKLFYELGRQGLPAIAVLRTALLPYVAQHVMPDEPSALRAIEQQTIAQFGPMLPAEPAAVSLAQGRSTVVEHVAGEYWMDPVVLPAFAELRDAMRRRHAEMERAA